MCAASMSALADVNILWTSEPPSSDIRSLIASALIMEQKPSSPLQARRQARLAGEQVTKRLNSEVVCPTEVVHRLC